MATIAGPGAAAPITNDEEDWPDTDSAGEDDSVTETAFTADSTEAAVDNVDNVDDAAEPQNAAPPPPSPTPAPTAPMGNDTTTDANNADDADMSDGKPSSADMGDSKADAADTAQSGSGGAFGEGATQGGCPAICSPGLQTLWRWMTWKETVPGIAIMGTTLTLYVLHLQQVSYAGFFSVAALLFVLAGGAVRAHNRFMDPAIPALRIPICPDACKSIGTHLGLALAKVVAAMNAASKWDNPARSAQVLAHLWLLFRFSGLLFSPTFLTLVVLAMFLAPMCFDMLKTQLRAVYDSSLKPIVSKALAAIHKAHGKIVSLDRNRLALVGVGVLVSLFIVWQLLGSYIGIFCLIKCALTTASLAAVVAEHSKCCGCPGAAASSTKKTQ